MPSPEGKVAEQNRFSQNNFASRGGSLVTYPD